MRRPLRRSSSILQALGLPLSLILWASLAAGCGTETDARLEPGDVQDLGDSDAHTQDGTLNGSVDGDTDDAEGSGSAEGSGDEEWEEDTPETVTACDSLAARETHRFSSRTADWLLLVDSRFSEGGDYGRRAGDHELQRASWLDAADDEVYGFVVSQPAGEAGLSAADLAHQDLKALQTLELFEFFGWSSVNVDGPAGTRGATTTFSFETMDNLRTSEVRDRIATVLQTGTNVAPGGAPASTGTRGHRWMGRIHVQIRPDGQVLRQGAVWLPGKESTGALRLIDDASEPKNLGRFADEPESTCRTRTIRSISNQLDLLWVVDGSLSFLNRREIISRALSELHQAIDASSLDLRMGVASTDLRNQDWFLHAGGFSTDSDDFTNALVNPPLNGNGPDQGYGLETALTVIDLAARSDAPEALGWREEAERALIFISTREDQTVVDLGQADANCQGPGLTRCAFVSEFIERLQELRIQAWAILGPHQGSCQPSDANAQLGGAYRRSAWESGGGVASLCTDSPGDSVASVARGVLARGPHQVLPDTPIPSTIRVLVNEQPVPYSATDGWTWESPTNQIVFHGEIAPTLGDSLTIRYSRRD